MDRSWLRADWRTQEFRIGVNELLKFAVENECNAKKLSWPCIKYAHSKSWKAQTVKDHLFQNGIDETYMCWIWHGEHETEQSPIVSEHIDSSQSVEQIPMQTDGDDDVFLDSSEMFNQLNLENEPLYPGCEGFTKMTALVKLYNIKEKFEMSDSCFSELLLLLGTMLPEGNCLPSSFGEAKKTLYSLGMEYEKYMFVRMTVFYIAVRWMKMRLAAAFVRPRDGRRTKRETTLKAFQPSLSGNIIKGYNGCVVCVNQTKATRLSNYRKTVVMQHRRWLPRDHPYRKQKSAFDNTVEKCSAPVPLTREEVFERKDDPRPVWKKLSIFFQLEYWKLLSVRHILDVMHIEKNICEALLGTLLNIPKKTKDKESVRLDMAAMGIRLNLRPEMAGKKEKLPLAS
ncbi:uncharacterized protein LOC141679181 [Apium graveolens]|uniref:uncharacterized protein LOC141679181 n=1 Tax=Apium graveolens TaxID=4045 RepID=UPI003D7A81E7